MNKIWYFLLSFFVILLDQVSKILILISYSPYQSLQINRFFNITLAFNTGSAFSFLSDAGPWHHWFFIGFGIFMSGVIVAYILKTASDQRLQLLSFSLILGGALGNVVDRLRLGYVIDFIDLHYNDLHWPVFNIADCAICIGAFLLLIEFAKPIKFRSNQTL